jgi:branched-subunit amino acid ABC-type transport system permease component
MLTFVVTGLITGSVYALLAVGLVFMYQNTGVVFFALGAFGALAAFTFSTLRFGHGPWLSLVVVALEFAALGAVIGMATTRVQTTNGVVKSVASLALTVSIVGVIPLVWGSTGRPIPTLSTSKAFEVFDVVVSKQQAITFVLAIGVAIGVVELFRRGSLGSALRAMAANTNVARLIGLPVKRLWVLAWVMTTTIAAIAGVLIIPAYGLQASSIAFTVLYPLAAALAAGFRRPVVAVVAAFALGIGDSMLRSQIDPFRFKVLGEPIAAYAPALPFLLVVAALIAGRSARFATWERV